MTETYTKLFTSITASTVWFEPAGTRLTWITMLAMADQNGCVYAAIPGLAHHANLPREEVERALQCFLSPDPDSRTQDHEGRRIEEIDGGWRLLNHAKFHAIRMEAERAAYKKEWDRQNRPSGAARHKSLNPSPTQSDKSPTQSDTPTISDRPDPPDHTKPYQLTQEPNGSCADAPKDPVDPIWGSGLNFLIRRGLPMKAARTLLGKLKQAAGDIETGAILAKAEADDITDIVPWLMAAASKAKAKASAAPRQNYVNGKPSAAANFHNKVYKGTPMEDLPPELRPSEQGTS